MTDENSAKLKDVKLEDKKEEEATTVEGEDVVDPWNVASTSAAGVNYDKLIGTINTYINSILLLLYYNFFFILICSKIWIVENRPRAFGSDSEDFQ